MLRRLMHGTLAFDWTRVQPRPAALCMPAVAVPLALGVALGQPRLGMMVAAGGFSVGFGSFQELRGSRRLPMLGAAAGMCLSSWIGTILGGSPTAAVVLAGIWGAAYGAAWSESPGVSWIALQCTIWLLISTAFPAHGLAALTRGACVAGGGLLQMAVVWTTWAIRGTTGHEGGPAPAVDHAHTTTRQRLWHAVHASTILVLSMALGRMTHLANSYWIPMTAAIVTRPELRLTVERGVARTAGTLAGAAIATAAAFLLHPLPWLLALLVVIFAAAAYLLLYVNYAAFAASLTAYVVFLLTLAGAPERAVIARRALCTVLGAGLAWLGHVLFAGVERTANFVPSDGRPPPDGADVS
ncbi:MAG TPA: FUSC family protein [Polyangia bacterium]|nr:FUSC family protein [Polyangia bacterium]